FFCWPVGQLTPMNDCTDGQALHLQSRCRACYAASVWPINRLSRGNGSSLRRNQRMHDVWKDMFVLAVPILEKILRPIVIYAFLIISLRLSGKRELVQLNPFDLVVLLTLSNTVQNAIIGDDNTVTGGVIGATSLLIVNYLVVRFLYKHRKLDQLVEGRADVLIEDGKVKTHNLKQELITMAQLKAAARKQGFESIHEVQQCVLEPGGTIT